MKLLFKNFNFRLLRCIIQSAIIYNWSCQNEHYIKKLAGQFLTCFLFEFMRFSGVKYRFFSKPVQETASKEQTVVLKEDFCLFSGPVPLHKDNF